MIKRALILLCCLILLILLATGAVWCGVNYYIIPKIVIPQINEQVAIFNHDNHVKLKVKEVDFHPLRGFQLKGIELRPILTAKEVDIDIDYFALLSRKIHLPQITIIEANLNISRAKNGMWNFETTLGNLFGKEGKNQSSFVDIDQIIFVNGRIFFDDQLYRNNQLTKHFKDVNIRIKCPNKNDYAVEASGLDVKLQDAIQFKFNYSAKTGQINGKTQLKITNLADYRDYYLDDILQPWHLKKAQVVIHADFSYQRGDFSIDGIYEVLDGQLNYGDIRLAGNGLIKHKQKYIQGNASQSFLNAQADLANMALLLGKTPIVEKVKCMASLNQKAVQIRSIKGFSQNKPIDLHGQFVFQPVRILDLSGKIGDSANKFHLKLLSNNVAQVDWLASSEASFLLVDANLLDIKKLLFSGRISGQADLSLLPGRFAIIGDGRHLTVSVEASKRDLKGQMGFSGNLQGKLDKPETLFGKLGLKFDNFSILGLDPLSFLLGIKIEKGVFSSGIPPMHLYQGTLSGAVVLDSKHWGVELNIEDMDLAKFTRVNPQLAGLTGLFTGKIAGVGRWGKMSSIRGGGSFKLTNADLKKMSIFSSAQQGVGTLIKDFKMPDFKEVTGNFEISNQLVSISNAQAKAPNLELRGSGSIDFSRQLNFILGVKFIQQHDLKTAFYIIFPLQTLGFDLLSKTIKVEIKGVMPDLKQITTLQPLAWLTDAFSPQSSFDPDQYTLDKLW
ncbi:MAG: AsmA-like C-terminal region-containing protein [Candidatus Margulisiibacteriota bacterium]